MDENEWPAIIDMMDAGVQRPGCDVGGHSGVAGVDSGAPVQEWSRPSGVSATAKGRDSWQFGNAIASRAV